MADDDDRLDGLLLRAGPTTTTITSELEDELARMSVRARQNQRERKGRRRVSPAAALGLAGMMIVGGAGASAAALGLWPWWKDEPPAPFTYTLPSGTECETRIVGNVHGPSPEVSTATLEYLRGADIFGVLDVDAEVAKLRANGDDQPSAGSTVWEGSRPHYFLEDTELTPDQVYQFAVVNAVTPAVARELQHRGFDVEADQFSWQHETKCDGPLW